MKRIIRSIFTALLAALLLSLSLASCGGGKPQETVDLPEQRIDYAAAVRLDMSSATAKQQVTVKTFIDGDTTHFYVPSSVILGGVLKARYLAVNTPESTGKIEEWGKKASSFTKDKLSSASSIIVESDSEKWEADSTGSRYLAWIWYRTSESEEYRNLNIELLQNGLAIASSAANNRYGKTCVAAIAQAKEQKLNLYSGEKDPDFYYGEAIELDLRELRSNIASYVGSKVAFEGVITVNDGNSIYIESYDSETEMLFGISVYYGFGLTGEGLSILSVGNLSRIVGTVQYYEAGGTYQVSGLTYRVMKPDDPSNIRLISTGHAPDYLRTDPTTFTEGTVTLETHDGEKEFAYAELALATSIEMDGLFVRDVYTTSGADSSSNGAMTLTCEADGKTVVVRTTVLRDETGAVITADAYKGKTISVCGIVDIYSGAYQIKVFSGKDITTH